MNDEQGAEQTPKSFSEISSAPAIPVPPVEIPATSMMNRKVFLFSVRTWIIISAVAILIGIGIVAVVLMTNKEDKNPTKDQATKNPSALSTSTKPSESSAQKFAQVGDVTTVLFPNNIKDGTVPINVKVTRILKLIPEAGRTSIDLRACSNIGCHPMHAVEVATDEALAVVDLEFTNSSTDTDRKFWAYFQGYLEARFKTDGANRDVFSLKYANNQWFEEKPSFYIEPMKTMKVTFWTRVPQGTKSVEFVYAKDFSRPILSVPMSFEPVLSADMKAEQELQKMIPNSSLSSEGKTNSVTQEKLLSPFDLSRTVFPADIMQSGIAGEAFQPYREQIKRGERLTCAFDTHVDLGPEQKWTMHQRFTIDGEKFRHVIDYAEGPGGNLPEELTIFDGTKYYQKNHNNNQELVQVIDRTCLERIGSVIPSISYLYFGAPAENVACQTENNPDFSIPN
nr:hypothetical protein [Candidatus Moranbacteria bacterium]